MGWKRPHALSQQLGSLPKCCHWGSAPAKMFWATLLSALKMASANTTTRPLISECRLGALWGKDTLRGEVPHQEMSRQIYGSSDISRSCKTTKRGTDAGPMHHVHACVCSADSFHQFRTIGLINECWPSAGRWSEWAESWRSQDASCDRSCCCWVDDRRRCVTPAFVVVH